MILKLIYLILITFLFSNFVFSNENDCSQFEKMSAKYIECNAKKFKSKTDKKANELKVKTNQKAKELKSIKQKPKLKNNFLLKTIKIK